MGIVNTKTDGYQGVEVSERWRPVDSGDLDEMLCARLQDVADAHARRPATAERLAAAKLGFLGVLIGLRDQFGQSLVVEAAKVQLLHMAREYDKADVSRRYLGYGSHTNSLGSRRGPTLVDAFGDACRMLADRG